jgi:hypothetical protein
MSGKTVTNVNLLHLVLAHASSYHKGTNSFSTSSAHLTKNKKTEKRIVVCFT